MTIRKSTVFLSVILIGVLSFAFSSRAFARLSTLYPQAEHPFRNELVLKPEAASVLAQDPTLELKLVAAEQVVARRLDSLNLVQPYGVASHNGQLTITLPEQETTPYVTSVIAHVGKIEFIDGGPVAPAVGERVETGPVTDQESHVYQTLFTGQDIDEILPADPSTGQIFHQITLKPVAAQHLAGFAQTGSEDHICIVMDQEVVSCSAMYNWADETLEIMPNLQSDSMVKLADLAIFLDSGPLPMPFKIVPH